MLLFVTIPTQTFMIAIIVKIGIRVRMVNYLCWPVTAIAYRMHSLKPASVKRPGVGVVLRATRSAALLLSLMVGAITGLIAFFGLYLITGAPYFVTRFVGAIRHYYQIHRPWLSGRSLFRLTAEVRALLPADRYGKCSHRLSSA